MLDARLDDRGFRKKMRRLIANAPPKGEAMKIVSGMMLHAVEQNFRVQGRPSWKPLSRKYRERRAKMGKSGKIMQISGHLATSIQPSYGPTHAAVGTNVTYAKYHHGPEMTKHASKGIIPERPFLKMTQSDLDKIRKRIKLELVQGIA